MPAAADIPDRALQAALEFAVGIAAVSAKQRLGVPFPAELKPFLKVQRLPLSALGVVREALERDGEFLRRLGMVATDELVDPVGMLWLTRPEGWEVAIIDELAAQDARREAAEEATDVRREQRRREAAETAAMRARIEVAELRDELSRERDAVAALTGQLDAATNDLAVARTRVKELEAGLRKRAAGADAVNESAQAANEELAALRVELSAAQAARDAALTVRAGEVQTVDLARVRALLQEAIALTAHQDQPPGRARKKRVPLSIPGGMYGNTDAATEHLLKSPDVMVVVDGYNVAKLGWPSLSLRHQRERCIEACEAVARRWGTDVQVVFDGADVVGAHAPRRMVRVTFSPQGVLADDVIREHVAALDQSRPVVVVTNDQAVQVDVKAAGANVVTSDAFLAVAR